MVSEPRTPLPGSNTGVSRRTLLRGVGVAGLLSTLGVGHAGAASERPFSRTTPPGQFFDPARRVDAFAVRVDAARRHAQRQPPTHRNNGDETRYGSPLAMFTKGLPHDEYGEVDPEAYEALLAALRGEATYDDIPLGGDAKFVNPQASRSYNMIGPDPHGVTIDPAPQFDSAESAAEMVELYWQSQLRDVPFHDYETNDLAQRAAVALSELDGFAGPRDSTGAVTPDRLFRGSEEGNLDGPHLSQFFYHPVPRGDVLEQEQRYRVYRERRDFMTGYDEWLARQNGESVAPRHDRFRDSTRYLLTGRDLATYVHLDYGTQAYTDAALILLGQFYGDGGVEFDPNVPVAGARTQAPFVDFTDHDVLSVVGGVLQPSQRATWAQKWLVHRRLRPEVFGGRVHNHLLGHRSYPVHEDLLSAPVLDDVYGDQGSYLLSQAFPEGSPTHPAYPAGHAGIAGACTTVLKAYFDESSRLPVSVPTADGQRLERTGEYLTVGGELNKLASNMSVGRNWAGIHYRSDADDGIRLGEAVAVGFLVDRARTYDDRYGFDGFEFTSFDGERLRITSAGAVPA